MRSRPYGPFTMGIQSYSLRHFPAADMLTKLRALGLRDVEVWDGHFPVTDDPARIAGYRAMLDNAGVAIHAYGVIGFSGDAADSRRKFAFAKAMGIRTLSADPTLDAFEGLDHLVREFDIRIAIHNHGPGARWSKPEAILDAIKGHDDRIGVCIDTGHYLRSDVNPVDAARMFKKRVHGVHLKDVRTVAGRKEFTEIGKGALDTLALLRVLKANRFRGLRALEYEEHEEDPSRQMEECLRATEAAARRL